MEQRVALRSTATKAFSLRDPEGEIEVKNV